uniref:CHK kinase-like domain-containing protein n=2 Tax=Clastoptera arizonana TaxID=38151 RepID=A0A1B6E7P5_9HEMI
MFYSILLQKKENMDTNIAIPSWLNNDFLTQLLKKNFTSNEINVLSFDTKLAAASGSNYTCLVIRVLIKFEENRKPAQKSIILKTTFSTGKIKDFIDEYGAIEKESFIYTKILPPMNDLMGLKITPKYLNTSITEAIALEDLNEDGYVMCDRVEQLNFDHCNAFMEAIGKFHALSYRLHELQPNLFDDFIKEDVFTQHVKPEIKEYLYNTFHSFRSVLEEWNGFQHIAEFIKNNLNSLWDKIVEIHSTKKHLRVLNHGDPWVSNMLFKYDDSGKIIDIKLIDLQTCKMVSPALDLIIFLLTSAQEDVLQHRLSELYNTYLNSFNSVLKCVGSDFSFSLKELHDELEFVRLAYLCYLPWHVVISLSEKDIVIDMDQTFEIVKRRDDNGKKQCWQLFNGKHFKKVAKYTLRKLEEQQFFSSF